MDYVFMLKHLFLFVPILDLTRGSEGSEAQFEAMQNWPKYDHFGQVSAVGVDNVGRVYVFHRGNRKWDANTFSMNDFLDRDKGPIPNETIVVLEPHQGNLLMKTGTNLFYLPHGLTVDSDNNIWVTDVAMHQVFKFLPLNFSKGDGSLGKVNMTLGVPFMHGNDRNHFCKPTGVAVDSHTKEFYVSDGYCNARIVKFDAFGNHLLSFGRTSIGAPQKDFYMFKVPHAVALAQERQILYVADRENSRVVSYDSQFGKFNWSFAEELRSRVFSVAYSSLKGGLLFVLTNDIATPKSVLIYDPDSRKLLAAFRPQTNFTNPHDLAVSSDGKFCYVAELNPYKVWKFKLDLPSLLGRISQSEKGSVRIEEPVPAESKVDGSGNLEASSSFLAGGLVVSIVAISFLIFMYHYYKRNGGYRRYESRRLILDDDEGGIQLT